MKKVSIVLFHFMLGFLFFTPFAISSAQTPQYDLASCLLNDENWAISGGKEGDPGTYTYTASIKDKALKPCTTRFDFKLLKDGITGESERFKTPDAQGKITATNIRAQAGYTYRACIKAQGWSDYKCGKTLTISGTKAGSGATPGVTPGGTPAVNPTNGGSGSSSCPPGQLCNPLKSQTLGQLMLVVMKGFIIIIAAWSVMFIVVGGFRMVISQGNSEALTKAKATITWAIAGVVVSLLAFSLVAIVQNLIGFQNF